MRATFLRHSVMYNFSGLDLLVLMTGKPSEQPDLYKIQVQH